MQDKMEQIKSLLSGQCTDITVHNVSADWYRRNVDIDYTGTQAVDVVQCTYDGELYAMPSYMTLAEFKGRTAQDIADEWAI